MTEARTSRKRKRPSYLVDFYESSREEEVQISKRFEIDLEAKKENESSKLLEKSKEKSNFNSEPNKVKSQEIVETNEKRIRKYSKKEKEKNDSNELDEMGKKVQLSNDDKKKEMPEQKNSKKKIIVPTPDDVYNIEALVEKRGSKYFVKWENYTEDQNTWEPKSSIPPYIIKVIERMLINQYS